MESNKNEKEIEISLEGALEIECPCCKEKLVILELPEVNAEKVRIEWSE